MSFASLTLGCQEAKPILSLKLFSIWTLIESDKFSFVSIFCNLTKPQLGLFIGSIARSAKRRYLSYYLRDPAVSRDTFCKHLKTYLFAVYWYTFSAIDDSRFYDDAPYKSTFYLLTYLLSTVKHWHAVCVSTQWGDGRLLGWSIVCTAIHREHCQDQQPTTSSGALSRSSS